MPVADSGPAFVTVAVSVRRPFRTTRVDEGTMVRTRSTNGLNVATIIVGDAGATRMCVAGPPSDHDRNPNGWPSTNCGDGALTLFADPTITVRVKGTSVAASPTAMLSPGGLESNVRTTI